MCEPAYNKAAVLRNPSHVGLHYDGAMDKMTYDTCSRCKGSNDRPTQRECRACHNTSMKKYRAEKLKATVDLNKLLDRLEAENARLVDENAVLLGKLVAAEAIAAAFVPRGISRETFREVA